MVDSDLGVLWVEFEQILHLKAPKFQFCPRLGHLLYQQNLKIVAKPFTGFL